MTVSANIYGPEFGLFVTFEQENSPQNPITNNKIQQIWYNFKEPIISITYNNSDRQTYIIKNNKVFESWYPSSRSENFYFDKDLSKEFPEILNVIKSIAQIFPSIEEKSCFLKAYSSL